MGDPVRAVKDNLVEGYLTTFLDTQQRNNLTCLEVGARPKGNYRGFVGHHFKVYDGIDVLKPYDPTHFTRSIEMDFVYFNERYYDLIFSVDWFNYCKLHRLNVTEQLTHMQRLALKGWLNVFTFGKETDSSRVTFDDIQLMLDFIESRMVKFYSETGASISLAEAKKEEQCICVIGETSVGRIERAGQRRLG